ncbi:MBL fold metallo-hydrolase, partial [Cronobacter sakazakii]
MMKTAATLLALFTFALAAPLGAAPLPVNSAQAPGYYRMMLGDWQITAVSDGTVTIPADKLLTRITPDALKTRLADDALTPQVETSINAYVINTGDKLILVDSGAGAL